MKVIDLTHVIETGDPVRKGSAIRVKGFLSVLLNVIAVIIAFIGPVRMISFAVLVAATVIWVIPDKLIEQIAKGR